MTIESITKQIQSCHKCELRQGASAPVPGFGNPRATYMILGEAPGRSEDEAGIPFVGKSGERLNRLLALAGIDINDCYLTNTCKCRPPRNRDPKKKERLCCLPFLEAEIAAIKPKYIISLGSVPLSLFTTNKVSDMHGCMLEQVLTNGAEVPVNVICQYHPAACLHQPRLWATMILDWANLPEKVDASYTIVGEAKSVPTSALDTEGYPQKGSLAEWSVAWRDAGQVVVNTKFGSECKMPTFTDKVVMHNAKYDLRVLKANGVAQPKPEQVVDTMIAAYCLGLGKQDIKTTTDFGDTGMVGGLGLKYLARRHLGMEMNTWDEVKEADAETRRDYNIKDSVATLLLWEKWKDKLPKHFWQIDMPLLDVLMCMEDRGICISEKMLKDFEKIIDEALEKMDIPLNPNSPQQVASYVYDYLGYEAKTKTKNGQPSTGADILEEIDDPVVQKILQYRGLTKEKSSYIDNYVNRLDRQGRVHCEFKQVRTATGRLASARPNLQNVPVEDSTMRELFIAAPGKKLIKLDYSQLELRVFAALTGDKAMTKAFREGRDIHQETSDYLTKRGFKIDRYNAKTINFLMLYGGSEYAISQQFRMPVDEAGKLIHAYYDKFPGIEPYFKRILEELKETNCVQDYFGRVRRIDAMFTEDWRIRKQGEREAINMPIQGTAGEIVKLAMIDLHRQHQAPMLLQVHDEIIFEVDKQIVGDYARWLIEYVPTLVEINGFNFPVSVGIGDNWLEAGKKENTIGD